MSQNTARIAFRAKRTQVCRDDFSVGEGYRVPVLQGRHVTFAERDTVAVLMASSLDRGPADNDMTAARLKRFAGFRLPRVVDADPAHRDERWTVTPIGSGLFADVSIELPMA